MMFVSPIVVNKYKAEYDIYIGRGSIWGNPIAINESIGDFRHIVIAKYKKHIMDYIESGVITIDQILSLSGKRLGCFCKPKDCHGDVLVEIFNEIVEMLNES